MTMTCLASHTRMTGMPAMICWVKRQTLRGQWNRIMISIRILVRLLGHLNLTVRWVSGVVLSDAVNYND